MNREEVYNPRRRERKMDFLYGIRVVRKYFCSKNDLRQGDFELICDLHALNTFRRDDFDNGTITLSWNQDRWKMMLDNEWIKVYREREPTKGRNYKIYKITRKASEMIEQFYQTLCGERPIPTTKQHNPVMKEKSYNDKRFAKAMRAFNEARSKIE